MQPANNILAESVMMWLGDLPDRSAGIGLT